MQHSWEGLEKCIKLLSKNIIGKSQLENLSIDDGATLKSIVRIETGLVWAGFTWSRIGTSGELM
jgi:hypothetical protein